MDSITVYQNVSECDPPRDQQLQPGETRVYKPLGFIRRLELHGFDALQRDADGYTEYFAYVSDPQTGLFSVVGIGEISTKRSPINEGLRLVSEAPRHVPSHD